MSKESTIQKAIVDYLNSLPRCRAVVNHGSGWQGAGRPDIFACVRGRFLALEVKNEIGQATKLQIHELTKWGDADAMIGIVRDVEQVKTIVERMP